MTTKTLNQRVNKVYNDTEKEYNKSKHKMESIKDRWKYIQTLCEDIKNNLLLGVQCDIDFTESLTCELENKCYSLMRTLSVYK